MPTEPHPTPPSTDPRTANLLEEFIAEHEHRLWRIAASIAGPDQADDAVQSACLGFLRAFNPDTAHGGAAGAFSYLARATANAAAKLVRTDARRRRGLPPAVRRDELDDPVERAASEGASPEDLVMRLEETRELEARLEALPEEWREVLLARAAGYSPAEIQAALGLTERQYRKRIERANRRLGKAEAGRWMIPA